MGVKKKSNVFKTSQWSKLNLETKTVLFFQGVNVIISAVKLDVLFWESVGIHSLLQPDSRSHSRNRSFLHFHIGFIFQKWMLHKNNLKQTDMTLWAKKAPYFYTRLKELIHYQNEWMCKQTQCI